MKKLLAILYFTFPCSFSTLCSAQYTSLLNLNGTNGAGPDGSLTLFGKVLYGMGLFGGANNNGVVFSIDTNGNNYKDLLDFNDLSYPQGWAPTYCKLTLSGKVLYGTTHSGGANTEGIVFSVDTDGSNYKDLHDFSGADGQEPENSLLLCGKVLYGTTWAGGVNALGNIFSIDTDGSNFRDIFDFNGLNGQYPFCALTISGKVIYGMTEFGGITHDSGCIFSIDTNGSNYRDLLDFNGTNGANPIGSLLLLGKDLFGMTQNGGAHSDGLIFSIDTNGNNYRDLLDFNGINGQVPFGSLTPSGCGFFGMTTLGGVNNDGVIFSIDTNGSNYIDLFDFNGSNGQYPYGDITISGKALYGMTSEGGTNTDGVVFRFKYVDDISIVSSKSNDTICSGDSVILSINPATPTNYIWNTGATTDSIKVNPLNTTKYYAVANVNCATDSAFLTLTVNTVSAVINGKDSICKGDSVLLIGQGGVTYQWSTSQTNDSIQVAPMSTTTYTITAYNGACHADTTITVTVNTTPIGNVCCDTTITPGENVLLISSGGTTYLWSPPTGLNCNTCSNPIASPPQTTTYTVTINNNGCVSSETVTIDVGGCGDVFVPNVFSPSATHNNMLYVRGACIATMDFSVFDRWGNRVFESHSPDNGWSGSVAGSAMNPGTFMYYLNATLLDGRSIKKHGDITLVR